jgi:argininosuccinate lyase
MQQDSSFYEITLITNNLPGTNYNCWKGLFPAIQNQNVDIAIFSIKDIKVKNNILADKIRLLIYCRLIEWVKQDAYKAVAEQLEHFQSPKKPNTLMKEVLIIVFSRDKGKDEIFFFSSF